MPTDSINQGVPYAVACNDRCSSCFTYHTNFRSVPSTQTFSSGSKNLKIYLAARRGFKRLRNNLTHWTKDSTYAGISKISDDAKPANCEISHVRAVARWLDRACDDVRPFWCACSCICAGLLGKSVRFRREAFLSSRPSPSGPHNNLLPKKIAAASFSVISVTGFWVGKSVCEPSSDGKKFGHSNNYIRFSSFIIIISYKSCSKDLTIPHHYKNKTTL